MVFLLLISVFAGGCAVQPEISGRTTVEDKTTRLLVGVSTNAPPLIFRENNRVSGLEAALAQKLGVFSNKEIVFIEVPWDKQLEYLEQGKTDIIMSGMTITPQRSYLVDFITPYLRSGQVMLVRLEDRQRFSGGVTDVMNTHYKIGTITDTTGDFFVSEAIAKANEVRFKTSAEAVTALIDKDIDVLIHDAPVICHYAAVNQSEKLAPILVMATEEYLAWAVRKNDGELKNEAERFIRTITENGELAKEINTWMPYLSR